MDPCFLSLQLFQIIEVAFPCMHITLKPLCGLKGGKNSPACEMAVKAVNVSTLK